MMDLELRESVDRARRVDVTLAPDLTVTIRWGGESRSFRLGVGEHYARDRAFEWFQDVVGLSTGDLRLKLWSNGIEVSARRPSSEWGPTIELIDAIARSDDPIEADPQPEKVRNVTLAPAVLVVGRDFLVRSVTHDSLTSRVVIEPFHGYRIPLQVSDVSLDGDLFGFATPLGDFFARRATTDDVVLVDLSRFGRLWDPEYRTMGDVGEVPGDDVLPDVRELPSSAQKALFTRLTRIGLPDGRARNAAERDVESLEIFAGYGGQRIRSIRHVLHRPSGSVVSSVAGKEHDSIDDDNWAGLKLGGSDEPPTGIAGFWAPIGLRAAARVDWHPEMRTRETLLLAADPEPIWWELPLEVRENIIRFLTFRLHSSDRESGQHGEGEGELVDPAGLDIDGDFWDLDGSIGGDLTWYDLAVLAGRLIEDGSRGDEADVIEVLQGIAAAHWTLELPNEPVFPVGHDEDPRMPDDWD